MKLPFLNSLKSSLGFAAAIGLGLCAAAPAEEQAVPGRWSVEKAQEWYAGQPWLVGCNYIPATAINQLEMWQADTFDRETIDKELGWAEDLGFNTLRVYLHDLVWGQDAEGLDRRMDEFLKLCDKRGMRVLFVFFDDCHRPDPKLGKQPLPVRGFHNSGCLSSGNTGSPPTTGALSRARRGQSGPGNRA